MIIQTQTPRHSRGSSHLLQLLGRDPKVLPRQLKDVVFTVRPGSGGTCLEHLSLQGGVPNRFLGTLAGLSQ